MIQRFDEQPRPIRIFFLAFALLFLIAGMVAFFGALAVVTLAALYYHPYITLTFAFAYAVVYLFLYFGPVDGL